MADLFDLTPSISLQLPQRGYFENIWDFPLNTNFVIIDRLFSGTSSGGGHGHTGNAGDGPKLAHSDLLNIGSTSHDDIDVHIADTTLHTDTKISSVSGDVSATPITVSNVTALQFANATVTNPSSGVALVTVTPNYGNSAPLYAKPESAAISYTDNFNWPAGTALSNYSWIVDKGANVNDPEFVINQLSAPVSSHGYKANLHIGSSVGASSGGVINHVAAHVPHGTAQRIAVHVSRLRVTAVNGLSVPPAQSTEAVLPGDSVALELHLMARSEYSGNYGSPLKTGIALNIRKRPTGVAVSPTIGYTVIVRSSATAVPVSVALPTGTWQSQPFEYFEGTHEFSLKRHSTIASAYYLQYYYNEGLVWSQLFLPSSALATAIDALQATLALSNGATSTIGGENPTFGRIGFAIGYQLEQGQEYDIDARYVSVASQDDLDVIKHVYLPPLQVPAASPSPSPSSPPVSPPQTAACASSAFSSYFIGDNFAFAGAGTLLDWVIASRFEAGQAPGGVGVTGPGFIVNSVGGTSQTYFVFCDPPAAVQPPTPIPINPNSLNGITKLYAANLMRGPYSQTSFLAGSTFSWIGPSGIEAYVPGDTLSSAFLNLVSLTAANSDADPQLYATLNWTSGNQLPWGALIDIQMTAAYDGTYTTTWTSELSVRPARPLVSSTSVFVYDTIDSAPPVWVGIQPTGDEFVEGSDLLIAVVARNLPLGANFWSTAASEDGWPANWRVSSTGTALRLITDSVINSALIYYTQLHPASFETTTTPTGVPPAGAVPNGQQPAVTYGFSSAFSGETMVAFVKFPVGTWKDAYLATGGNMNTLAPLFSLRLSDPVTNAFTAQTRTLINMSQLLPRDPIVTAATISDTATGVTADISVTLQFLDSDVLSTSIIEDVVEFNLIEGFQSLGLASAYTVTDLGSGLIRVDCFSCGPLSNTPGEDIRIQIKNVAAYNWIIGAGASQASGHSISGEVTITLGVTSAAPLQDIELVNSTIYADAATTTAVALYEDQDIVCYAKLKNITVTTATQADVVISFTPDYFDIIGQVQFATVPAMDGSYLTQFTVRTTDSGSQIPGTVVSTVVSFTRIANASVADSNAVTIVDTKDPSFLTVSEVDPEGPSVRLGLTTATMQSGPSSNVWDMSLTGWGIGTTAILRTRTLDAQDNAILRLIQSVPALEFVDGIGQSLGSTAQGVWLNSGLTPPSGVDRDINVRLLPGAVPDTVIGLEITNPSLSGESHVVTDVAAITLTTTNIPGGGLGGSGNDGGALLGSGENAITLFPTAIAPIVIYQSGSGIFQITPIEGQYFEFIIPGSFVIDNPGDPTDAFTVEFMTLEGDYLATSVVLTAASTSQLVGSARALALTAGSRLTIRVSESSTGDVVALVTDQHMQMEPTPVITGTYGQVEEASTDVSVIFYGFDLIARVAPAGQPVLGASPVLEIFNGGPVDYLSGASYILSDTSITATFDVAADSAGETIGIRITTLGGRTYSFQNLLPIEAAYTTAPTVESLIFYNAVDQALIDNEANVVIAPPPVSVDGVARLLVTGTDLTLRNIADAYLEVVGEKEESTLHIETPPGPGLAPRLKTGDTNRIYRLSTISQSATKLIMEFPAIPDLANSRVRVHLLRPDDHPIGSGDWGDAIDATGEGDLGGITGYGMTVKYGTTVTGFQLNKDKTVSNNTQYAAALAAQANVANGYGGYSFSITLRFESALTGAIPEIISVPDPDYGTEFIIGPATLSANRFEMTFDVTVPLPGVDNTYPDYCSPGYSPSPSPALSPGMWPSPIQDGSPSPSPGTCPFDPNYVTTACGLRLANGQSILSVVLGRADWGGVAGHVS